MIIEINKDIEKYQESVAMGLSAKQLAFSILALGSGCVIVFVLYEKIGLTFSCYVVVPIVAPIALCGFYSYNGMGFREVFIRYMRSIFRNKALVFQSSGYRETLLDYLDQIEYNIIETDEGTVELAEKFIDFGFLKRKSYDDCRHIAAAILAGCDFIISWNFKHIVNVKTIRGIKAITTYEGYKDLMIYPPSALLEEEEEDYGSDDKRT